MQKFEVVDQHISVDAKSDRRDTKAVTTSLGAALAAAKKCKGEPRIIVHEGRERNLEFTRRSYSRADLAVAGVSRADQWHGIKEYVATTAKPKTPGKRKRAKTTRKH